MRFLGHVLRRERQRPLQQSNYRRAGRRSFGQPTLMEKAWEIVKREDASLPHRILLINQTVTRGKWLSNALANTDHHSATRKLKHLSVNVWLNLSVKISSQCELPIAVWVANLSVNYPPQCERTLSVWTNLLNVEFFFNIIFWKSHSERP